MRWSGKSPTSPTVINKMVRKVFGSEVAIATDPTAPVEGLFFS